MLREWWNQKIMLRRYTYLEMVSFLVAGILIGSGSKWKGLIGVFVAFAALQYERWWHGRHQPEKKK